MDYAAHMAIEVGKNRLEALGEVEESGRPAALLRRHDGAQPRLRPPDGQPWRRGRPHSLDPRARMASSPSSARSTSRWPCAAARPARRSIAGQHGRLQAVAARAACQASTWPRPTATPACPTGVSTWSWARARRSGRSSRRTRAIDGIVFTGSFEVGFALFKNFSTRFPEPAIVEMGGKNPAIVTRQGRPRGGGRGHHARSPSASAARSARPTAASTSSDRSMTSWCELLVEKTEAIDGRRPAPPAELDGTGHRPARRRPATSRRRRGAPRRHGLHRRRAPDPWRPGARLLRRADGRRAPARRPPPVPRRAVRAVHRGRRRSTRSTRPSGAANDTVYWA